MGQIDAPLLESGKKEAIDLADELKRIHFDGIYTSPLVRAQETANILAQELNLPVKVDSSLSERFWGGLQKLSWSEIAQRTATTREEITGKSLEEMMDYKVPFPDEQGNLPESTKEAVERLVAFLEKTSREFPGKTFIVVTHTGMISSLLIEKGKANHNDFWPPNIVSNAGYIVVSSNGNNLEIEKTKGVEGLN